MQTWYNNTKPQINTLVNYNINKIIQISIIQIPII